MLEVRKTQEKTMKRIACIAMLMLLPGAMFAATSQETSTTTGTWMVDANVMGQPVKMTCALVDTSHKLSGTCAAAADNFTPHKVAGTVKAQAVEVHFESYVQGTPITVILSGTLSADASKMDGELDIEPMSASGMFVARRLAAAQGTPAPPPAVPPAAPGAVSAATGTWKVDGDIQGTPVPMTCALSEVEKKLTGSCSGGGDDMKPHKVTGEVKEKGVVWQFDSEYQGSAITVSMAGTISGDGMKMNGTISVAPMGVDGTFTAVKQSDNNASRH